MKELSHPLGIKNPLLPAPPLGQKLTDDSLLLAGGVEIAVKVPPIKSDRSAFPPIRVASNQSKIGERVNPNAPEAWSNLNELLGSDAPQVTLTNPAISRPPLTATNSQVKSQINTRQLISPHLERRQLEIIAKEIFALMRQQLPIEKDLSSQNYNSGKLPW